MHAADHSGKWGVRHFGLVSPPVRPCPSVRPQPGEVDGQEGVREGEASLHPSLFPVKAVMASCIMQGSRDGGRASLTAERRGEEMERLTD